MQECIQEKGSQINYRQSSIYCIWDAIVLYHQVLCFYPIVTILDCVLQCYAILYYTIFAAICHNKLFHLSQQYTERKCILKTN